MREHINGLDKLCFIAYFCKKLQITLESFYFTGNVDYLFRSEFAQGFNKFFCCTCSWSALLNSLQGVPESVGSEQGISAAELRIVVEEAVETALRKYLYFGSAIKVPESQVSKQDIVVKKPSRAHKSEPSPPPRQPKPLERPMSKQMPEPDEPAASDENMDVLLSMADAFY